MHASRMKREGTHRRTRMMGTAFVVLGLSGCTAAVDDQPTLREPTLQHTSVAGSVSALPAPLIDRPDRLGRLEDDSLIETSGLAVSLDDDRLLWAINDSGQAPELLAMDLTGSAKGRWPVAAKNIDWEDLDSGYLNGQPTLVIADTGNNRWRRPRARLWFVTEPDPPTATASNAVLEATQLWFKYEDGPRDVEAMALADNTVWLLSKEPLTTSGQTPARLYRLDLANIDISSKELPLARHVATLKVPPAGFKAQLAASLASIDLNQPTALDIDEVRGVAWVLTYEEVQRFDRQGDESWALTLAREPVARHRHGLAQAEALAVTASGLVVYTSEGKGAPLDALPPLWPTSGLNGVNDPAKAQ